MKRMIQSLALALAAAMLIAWSGTQHPAILASRKAFTPGEAEVLENTPPLVAFVTVALGGFRGLIADALWLRATRLQQDGRVFELVQLADWITKLEPRFTPAWSFHAWNLAYNVSVMMNEPEERWRWVQQGVAMLRDRGLVYNPGSAQLHWDLGWLYQHKIGQDLDDAHPYYKEQLARQMATVLDGRAPDYDALQAAPRTLTEIESNPAIRDVADRLRSENVDPANLDALLDPGLPPGAAAIRDASPAFESLVNALRRQRLEQEYRMNLDDIRAADEEFGPLDWRLPDSHAIYWARLGRPHASGFQVTQLQRMCFQCLSSALRRGHAFYDVDGNMIPSPNLDLLPRVRKIYEDAIATEGSSESFKTAHRNFLDEVLVTLVAYNRLDEARDVFRDRHQTYPDEDTALGFDAFIVKKYVGSLDRVSSRQAQGMIEGMAAQSFLSYAMGDEERYAGFERQGRLIWKSYRGQFKTDDHWNRMKIPPYPDLRRRALRTVHHRLTSEAAKARLTPLVEQLDASESTGDSPSQIL